MKRSMIGLLVILSLAGTLPAAEPPGYINYQGVLRDADGDPLDGTHDMVFRLYDAETLGDLLLTDSHTSSDPVGSVAVSGGLFNVHLGEGTITPGTQATLAEAFGNHDEVWLAVQVGVETLAPRIRVVAAAYALNAGRLGGKDSSSFLDTSSTTQTKAGQLTITPGGSYGIMAYGDEGGAYFQGAAAVTGMGTAMGAYFGDLDDLGNAIIGSGARGIEAYGREMGGYFEDTSASGSGIAYVGYGDRGIQASGTDSGGHFTGGVFGVAGYGTYSGGFFSDTDEFGTAEVGIGDRGIEAYGLGMGGYFWNTTTSASGMAYVAEIDRGIRAYGTTAAGYFADSETSPTGYASVGIPGKGIDAFGSDMGGWFRDTGSTGEVKLAWADHGIWASGDGVGGYFTSNGASATHAAWGTTGIQSYGPYRGARFEDTDDGTWADIASGSFGIDTNGTKNFVQNHPERDDRVIVYTAPEGNEVATYTRGSARLVAGEARIPLDKTFRWVTNPDIGLTAHLTPRGECNGLFVDALSTGELRVRELGDGGGDVVFDYIVWGLRLGFEELPVIRDKSEDAYLPRIDEDLAIYDRSPELRHHSALERFMEMRVANGQPAEVDLTASLALRNAIGVYDPKIHGPVDPVRTPEPPQIEPSAGERATEEDAATDSASHPPVQHPIAERSLLDRRTLRADEERVAAANPYALHPASEPIEAGDLVALDTERPGYLRRTSRSADPAVFGIANGEATVIDDETRIELVESRYARVKADASYGAIMAGDLLVSSPTPGHVMRAIAPLPGTIVGKAAQPLDTGTGLIKVLVILR